MSAYWIVTRTQANRERWAAQNVVNQGCDYYLPMFIGKDNKPSILFRRYLFVQINGPWRFLLSTFGVSSVILNGNSPSLVPDKVIDELKQRERENGFIELPPAPKAKFKPGQKLRVKDGAFFGFTGIHEQSKPHEREQILLNILGRETSVDIATQDLEEA